MKNTSAAAAGLLLALIATAACGYLKAGRWEDDPGNWERAFSEKKPADVVVVHSMYWRAAHFTYEAGYYFEIEANGELEEDLLEANELRPFDSSDAGIPEPTPDWFAPKPLESYEIWGYVEDPAGNFRLLIDRETATLFLTDFQI